MLFPEIMSKLYEVIAGIECGSISAHYDSLEFEEEPAEELHQIVSSFSDIEYNQKKATKAIVNAMLAQLEEFAVRYHVSELNTPIQHLKEYFYGMR